MWQHVKLSDVSLRPVCDIALVVDEDVKIPTNQTNKTANIQIDSKVEVSRAQSSIIKARGASDVIVHANLNAGSGAKLGASLKRATHLQVNWGN